MKTKTSAVLSIILWGIVLLVSVSLLYSLSTNNFNFTFFTGFTNNQGNKRLIQEKVIREDIQDVFVYWIAGGVTITQSDDEYIYFKEYATGDLARNKWATVDISSNRLSIESLNQTSWNFFVLQSPISYLELELPEKLYQSISLKLTSGNYTIEDLQTTKLDINATSGNLVIKDVVSEGILFNLTSGNIKATNVITNKMDVIMTSGNVTLDIEVSESFYNKMTSGRVIASFKEVAPTSIDFDMTTGQVEIDVDDSADFVAVVSKVSGSFNANFPHTSDGDRYIYKDGTDRYSFKMTSGSIKLTVNQ